MGCCLNKAHTDVRSSVISLNPKDTRNPTSTQKPHNNMINLFRLEYLSAYPGQCLYECGGQQSIIYLNPSTIITPKIYQMLFERGFIRNAIFFRKYETSHCCCIGYNMRIIASENKPTKKQIKIINNFLNVIELFEQQKQFDKIKQKDVEIQIIQNKIELKNNLQQNNESFPELSLQIHQYFQVHLQNIMQDVLDEEQIKLPSQDQIKIFLNKEINQYYCNYNLLIFNQNKSIFNRKNISQIDLNKLLAQKLNKKQFINDFFFLQNKKGYLNLTKDNSEQKQKKQVMKEKKDKQQQIKINESKNKLKESNINQNDIKLINSDTFQIDCFNVSAIKVRIIQPFSTNEIYQLYEKYMKIVHKDNDINEQSFQRYYATQVVEDEFIQNEQYRLKQGQCFMEYRINGKLIAIGVIQITQNYLISEYLFYDPQLKSHSFGIFATFVEIDYVKHIQKYFPEFKYQSLSYIISKNKSMNYKMQFNATEIQCCTTYIWQPFTKEIKTKMKNNEYILSDELLKQNLDISQSQLLINSMKSSFLENTKEVQQKIQGMLLDNYKQLGKDLADLLIFEYKFIN